MNHARALGFRKHIVSLSFGICLLSALLAAPQARQSRPDSALSDAEFWRMVTTFSETGGSFPSNNFVSNETAFQTVVPKLKETVAAGGVYMGVGPDQNFTYLVALKPRLAFIVDIRRQNLLQHLLYKAIIERSPSRVEFLSRLFNRPRPANLGDDAAIDTMIGAFAEEPPSEELFTKNFADVRSQLEEKHKFSLSTDDWLTMRFVYRAFFEIGPDLTYEGGRIRLSYTDAGGKVVPMNAGIFPTYGDLMMESDGHGVNHAYLATQDRYNTLRELETANLIVPIVGDFAGPKAIRAVAAYLKQQPKPNTVGAFYTSNVEQYLFQNGVWKEYYDNVAELPLDATSTFIRSFFPSQVIRIPFTLDKALSMGRPGFIESSQLLCPIKDLLAAVNGGTVKNYLDVIELSK